MGSDSLFNYTFGSQPKYGPLATSNEKQRQALINTGLGQINSIYGGGTTSFYTPASGSFMPGNTSYYSLTGKGFQPYQIPGYNTGPNNLDKSELGLSGPTLGFTGAASNARQGHWGDSAASAISLGASDIPNFITGLFGGSGPSPMEQAQQDFKNNKLYTKSDQTFTGFTPDFYKQREQAYIDNALPQEAQQYRDARNATLYGLSNRGLLSSSQATVQKSNLERTAGQAKQTIADTAISQSQDLQNQVEQSRQAAISQLYQTGDPSQATQSAINNVGSFQSPGVFAPLANMFSGLANTAISNKLINNYSANGTAMYGDTGPMNLTGGLPTTPSYLH